MLRLSLSFNQIGYQYTVLIPPLLPLISSNFQQNTRPSISLRSSTLKIILTQLLIMIHLFYNVGISTLYFNTPQIHHCANYPSTFTHPPNRSTMPVITRSSNNKPDETNALVPVPGKTTTPPEISNPEEFPPLGLSLLPAAKKTKATLHSNMDSKKVRHNGTTPKKDADNSTPTKATKPPTTVDLTISNTPIKDLIMADDSPANSKDDQGSNPPPRKLDQTFVTAENSGKKPSTTITQQGQEKKTLSFSAGMNFPTKTVDSTLNGSLKSSLPFP